MPKCVQPYLSSISELASCRSILLCILITIFVCTVISSLLLGVNILTDHIPSKDIPEFYLALGVSIVLCVLGFLQYVVIRLIQACSTQSSKSFNRCISIQQRINTKFDSVVENIETSKIEMQILAHRIDCIS